MVAIPAMCIAVGLTLPDIDLARIFRIFAITYATANVGFVSLSALALAVDLRRKTPVCNRYGCTPRFGLDYWQERLIEIDPAPPRLEEVLLGTLKALDPTIRILVPPVSRIAAAAEEVSESYDWNEPFIQSVRRGSSGPQATRIIQVHWKILDSGGASVCVQSLLDTLFTRWYRRRLPFLLEGPVPGDGGQSIENVEEYHLHLRRRVGLAELS